MRTNRQRPKSEWILEEVPAIVTPKEWELARKALWRNATRSTRNAERRECLLTSFLKCAICRDFTLVAIIDGTKKNPRRYHGCSSRNSENDRMLKTACYCPYVHADELEKSFVGGNRACDLRPEPDRPLARAEGARATLEQLP